MNKDFTIIFEKRDEHARIETSAQPVNIAIMAGETLGELDELAELRRVVAEITDPEPFCFTTA
jgi:hypothetical protein